MRRNLIFYCYPIRGSVWFWHIPRLIERLPVFNGRRLVVISVDDRTEDPDTVVRAFSPLGAETLIRRNDPKLAETAHFIEALSMVESRRDDEATFYAHAKGVTRKWAEIGAVLGWSGFMYDANLSRPELVDRKLEAFSMVGCLKWKHSDRDRMGWSYAGTFFWARHSALFSRDWRRIDSSNYGVEDYPGLQFPVKDGFCLAGEGTSPLDLYQGCADRKFLDKLMGELRRMT